MKNVVLKEQANVPSTMNAKDSGRVVAMDSAKEAVDAHQLYLLMHVLLLQVNQNVQ